jgi:hypothetical protein
MSKFCAGIAALACAATALASEPAPFLSFGVQPSEVALGQTARLSWASLNAERCTASGDWSGAQPASGTAETAALAAPATFTLTCTGRGGSVERRVAVNVVGPSTGDAPTPAPTAEAASVTLADAKPTAEAPTTAETPVSVEPPAPAEPPVQPAPAGADGPKFTLDATPLAVAYGADTTITWNAPDATKCIASGAWSGAKQTSGREVIRSLHGEARFSLTCMGARGATTKEVGVTVSAAAPVTVSLSSTAKVLAPNQETTLAWTSTGAETCSASGAWFGPRSTMGTEPTAPLATSSTFAITCSGPGGTASDSVAITVNAETAAALSYAPAN